MNQGYGIARVAAVGVAFLFSLGAVAQGMGARPSVAVPDDTRRLDDFAVEHYIKIEGRAEVRVEPTGIRVVFAVVGKGDTPSNCRERCNASQAAFLAALQQAGFAADAATSDFISMLPVYEWAIEEQNGQRVAVERRTGYLMQTNVHVRAADEAEADKAVAEAFRLEIPDVIAFDYWCRDLDTFKAQAQQQALAEARRKADLLLAVFDEKPKVINVDEATETSYPQALYRSFENTYSQQYQSNHWTLTQGIPQIAAMRPKNSYYAGFYGRVDVQDQVMPMRPQISVVSTVQIYYRSPAARGDASGRPGENAKK